MGILNALIMTGEDAPTNYSPVLIWTMTGILWGIAAMNNPMNNQHHMTGAEIDAAPVLSNGQLVSIEGVTYRVRIAGDQYSDPIHFVAA